MKTFAYVVIICAVAVFATKDLISPNTKPFINWPMLAFNPIHLKWKY